MPLPYCPKCNIRLLLGANNRNLHCTECKQNFILMEHGSEIKFNEAIFRIKRIFRDITE